MKMNSMNGVLLFPFLLLSQTQKWNYSIEGPGAAMQILYNNGNIYAVGSAPTNIKEVFEKTFFGPPEDEMGGVIRETPEQGYVIAGTDYQSGVYLINIDSIGNLIWSKFYDAAPWVVSGMELTLDGGYILVAYLWGGGIWLIKTDSMGDTLWTRTYTDASPGMSSKAIQQTADKGYIITGTTASNNGDVYLLKTDSLGNVMWTKTYWAPPGQNQQQFGCSVRRTNDNGYIVYAVRKVTSTSFGAWLLKTDSAGDTLWTKTYRANSWVMPTGCAEQTADSGYIIGGNYNTYPCFLLKTNAAGDSLWYTILNINNVSQFTDVQQTLDGGYIVTAQNFPYLYLSKRDSRGSEMWTTYYGNGLGAWGTSVYQTLDGGYIAAGTAYTAAAGDTTCDIYVVKTDSLGRPITKDFTIISLNQAGNSRWVYQYDGPAQEGYEVDEGFTIARDSDGNFYAGGFAEVTNDNVHSTIVSVDSNGNERWVYVHPVRGCIGEPVTKRDNTCVVYGADRNIYASGHELVGMSDYRGFIISFTSQGDTNWIYEKSGAQITSLVYGLDGNLYATGWGVYEWNFLIFSITSQGIERWVYEKNIGLYDRGISIVYGSDNNLYTCGIVGSSGALDFVVISVDTAGAERWIYTLDAGADDVAYDIVYGLDENIYATGAVGMMDWVVVKLDTAGNEKWCCTYDGPSQTADWGHSITYGFDNNLYTTGPSDSLGMPNFTVICVDTAGVKKWVYRGPWGWGWSVVQGDDNNIYAGGDGWYVYTGKGLTMMSIEPPTGIAETRSKRQEARIGLEIYPNPFSNKTDIRLQIADNSKVSLRIYDVTGRLIKDFSEPSLVIGHLSSEVAWFGDDDLGRKLPAGIYFCQLECKNKRETKKIIKVQ